jgi:hypothetical protein
MTSMGGPQPIHGRATTMGCAAPWPRSTIKSLSPRPMSSMGGPSPWDTQPHRLDPRRAHHLRGGHHPWEGRRKTHSLMGCIGAAVSAPLAMSIYLEPDLPQVGRGRAKSPNSFLHIAIQDIVIVRSNACNSKSEIVSYVLQSEIL